MDVQHGPRHQMCMHCKVVSLHPVENGRQTENYGCGTSLRMLSASCGFFFRGVMIGLPIPLLCSPSAWFGLRSWVPSWKRGSRKWACTPPSPGKEFLPTTRPQGKRCVLLCLLCTWHVSLRHQHVRLQGIGRNWSMVFLCIAIGTTVVLLGLIFMALRCALSRALISDVSCSCATVRLSASSLAWHPAYSQSSFSSPKAPCRGADVGWECVPPQGC